MVKAAIKREQSDACISYAEREQVRCETSMVKVGRVIDRAGLEIRYTPFGYRGFESLTFRKKSSMSLLVELFFYEPLCTPLS